MICVAGSLSTMLAAIALAKWLHLPNDIIRALAIKSVTAAVAVQTAPLVHANPALAGVFVISTGVIGAMLGPTLLDAINVRLPFARGLSFGTISHGIGTSQAVLKGELAGAVSGVAMGLGAIITAFSAPWIVPALVH